MIVIPPGETIKEQLETNNISFQSFCKYMDLTENKVTKLLNGEIELDFQIAFKLENILKTPAYFWLKLGKLYREDIKEYLNHR